MSNYTMKPFDLTCIWENDQHSQNKIKKNSHIKLLDLLEIYVFWYPFGTLVIEGSIGLCWLLGA